MMKNSNLIRRSSTDNNETTVRETRSIVTGTAAPLNAEIKVEEITNVDAAIRGT